MRILAMFPCEREDWQLLDGLHRDCLTSVFVLPEAAVPLNRISSGKIRRVRRAEISRASREELRKSPPDSVLWFGRLWSKEGWKFLRELVRLAPESLLTVVLGKNHAPHQHLEEVLLRIALWFRIIDYIVIGAGALRVPWKLDPQRYSALQSADGEAFSTLLQKRISAQRRSVLWVDPNLTAGSPSMRSLVHSIASLSRAGWSVRGLCYAHQQNDPLLETTQLPRLLPRALSLIEFFIACNLYRFIQSGVFRRRPAKIVHTTCAYDLQADLVSIHFCQKRWISFNSAVQVRSWRDRAAVQLSRIYSVLERLQLRSGHVRLLLPVSSAIGEAARATYGTSVPQIVLPNAFDESRFNIAVRRRCRESVRLELGFSENVTVFAFTSYGHYRRKGFWLIVDALRILQNRNDLRLLVIGGSQPNLDRLKGDLSKIFPDFSEAIVFVGMTDHVERYLAAADAFLFPSYFEAFCLAEIEAAAMGLPLLVTRHPGTEMIVRPGRNGLFVKADPHDIADKMQRFAAKEFVFEVPEVGEALTRREFAQRLASIYESFLVENENSIRSFPKSLIARVG
jgi:glycosyltransferase involved in cell wall biosynthesis